MKEDCAEVIDVGGVTVDMAAFNTPANRKIVEERTDAKMIALVMKTHDLTYGEAISKLLYHTARLDVKFGDRDGRRLEVEDD